MMVHWRDDAAAAPEKPVETEREEKAGLPLSPGFVDNAYASKAYTLAVVVLLDCGFMAWTDHVWSTQPILPIVFMVFSLVLQLGMVLLFFTTLWRTFLMRSGLLGLACLRFHGPFTLGVLRLLLLTLYRIHRLLYATNRSWCCVWVDGSLELKYGVWTEYWQSAIAMYLRPVLVLMTVIHHTMILHKCFHLSRTKYYIAHTWDYN